MHDKALDKMLSDMKQFTAAVPPHIKKLIDESEELMANRSELISLGTQVSELAQAQYATNPKIAAQLLQVSDMMLDVVISYRHACDEHLERLENALR